jgi:putative hydrolase of the HAD superfamily
LALRAVVFDYGMVLTGPQDPAAHAELVRLTGLPIDKFEHFYWQDRHEYDAGRLTGITYWQKFVRDAGLNLPDATIHELNRIDVRVWSTVNPRMVAWQEQLRQRGLKRAILSNMGDAVRDSIVVEHAWINTFDALIWSYQLGIIKPAPAIYLHALEKLGTPAQETLFIDDRSENTAAARALGMQAITFSTVDKLREDLIAAGLDKELPLP